MQFPLAACRCKATCSRYCRQTERNPLAEQAVGRLADAAGNRAVFLIGAAEPAAAAAAGARGIRRHICAAPKPSARWSRISRRSIRGNSRALYLQHRFSLLAAADRAALASGAVGPADLEARLQRKLYTPFRFGLTLPLADDPFGFSDAWLAGLPLKSLKLETENGLLVSHDQRRTWVVSSPPSCPDRPTTATLQQARRLRSRRRKPKARSEKAFPDAVVLRTGTVFYADAARQSAEREVDLIGAGSLLGMLLPAVSRLPVAAPAGAGPARRSASASARRSP